MVTFATTRIRITIKNNRHSKNLSLTLSLQKSENSETVETSEIVLFYLEVSLIQRVSNTIMYYCETGASFLNREASLN